MHVSGRYIKSESYKYWVQDESRWKRYFLSGGKFLYVLSYDMTLVLYNLANLILFSPLLLVVQI